MRGGGTILSLWETERKTHRSLHNSVTLRAARANSLQLALLSWAKWARRLLTAPGRLLDIDGPDGWISILAT